MQTAYTTASVSGQFKVDILDFLEIRVGIPEFFFPQKI